MHLELTPLRHSIPDGELLRGMRSERNLHGARAWPAAARGSFQMQRKWPPSALSPKCTACGVNLSGFEGVHRLSLIAIGASRARGPKPLFLSPVLRSP